MAQENIADSDIYAAAMRRIDRKHGVSDDGDQPGAD